MGDLGLAQHHDPGAPSLGVEISMRVPLITNRRIARLKTRRWSMAGRIKTLKTCHRSNEMIEDFARSFRVVADELQTSDKPAEY